MKLILKKKDQCSHCTNKVQCRGLCSMHYTRWRKHGDPKIRNRVGPKRQATCLYSALHKRLHATYGSASGYNCVDCGALGEEWSYEGTAGSDELIQQKSGKTLAFSINLDHYAPRCRSCHRILDRYLKKDRKARENIWLLPAAA